MQKGKKTLKIHLEGWTCTRFLWQYNKMMYIWYLWQFGMPQELKNLAQTEGMSPNVARKAGRKLEDLKGEGKVMNSKSALFLPS